MNGRKLILLNIRFEPVVVLSLAFLVSLNCCQKSVYEAEERKIDSLFQCYSKNKPGGQLSVSRNGRVIYSKAWGIADLENLTPITTETLIEAGSVSKQFTAAAILLLERQGKLKRSDPVQKHIPRIPSYEYPILIQHLIHHTSGLREWSDIADLAGSPEVLKVGDNRRVLDIICRQRSLNSKPGSEYRYSNSNYILLALIVNKVSGQSLSDYTRQYIFSPAGMSHTQWRDDPQKVVPNRSQAYEFKAGIFRALMPENGVHGSGGLLTTAEDLLKWNDFYTSGKLGGNELFTRQIASDTLANGNVNNYAAGLVIDNDIPKPVFSHSGATAGYRAKLICSPSQGLSVAWLSNTSMLDTVGDPATEVFRMLSKPADNAPARSKQTSRYQPDRSKLHLYKGLYKSGQSGRDVDITLGPKGLILSETPLEPIADGRFRFHNIILSFDSQGRLLVSPPLSGVMRYHRVDTTGDAVPREQYIGTFFSNEVNAPIQIRKAAGGLELVLVSGTSHSLENHFKDSFIARGMHADITFKRKGGGEIDAFEISTGRSLGIRFLKVTTVPERINCEMTWFDWTETID